MRQKRGRRPITRKKISRSKPSGTACPRSRSKPAWPQVVTPLPTISPAEEAVLNDLPFSYGETKLVLLVRDPYWAYSYWDFSTETWNGVQKKLAEETSLKSMMRVHDLDARRHHDLLISLEARNWYLHLGTPDRRYAAELGIGDGHSRFYVIIRSNEIKTPRDTPSEVVDSEWSDRDFDEIYRLSGGGHTGISSPGSLFFPRQTA